MLLFVVRMGGARVQRRLVAMWTCAALLAGSAVPASAAELVVGQVAPMEDPASIGHQLRTGVEVYFEQVNRKGGVHGARLRLAARHRGTRAEEAVAKTRELLSEENPIALIGFMGTGPMEALLNAKVLDEAAIALVGARTGATVLHRPDRSRWLFHTRANYAGEVGKILRHADTIGARRMAVYYEETAFGAEALALVEKALPATSVALVEKVSYKPDEQLSEEAAQRVIRSGANAVLVAASSEAAADFYQAYKAGGGPGLVVALSTADGALMVRRIGAEAARGLGIAHVTPDPASRTLPLSRELQALERAGAVRPGQLNQGFAEGYVAAKVLVEALRRAGPQPTRARVRQALEGLSSFDVGGFTISYSATRRSGSDYVDIAILSRDGKMLR
ncbi:ABC transporter substrate-binding protein [Schlegelella sp. S2-27]|uniref:ABC transporter substrate-binding protein n=1 Tax=Caldimonas mangrovi TaxID=2944811 RepID=A0ABT0YQR6_9BURK|nr:ABC transporter substrate-binding protein [Caldimonas mangrovi]